MPISNYIFRWGFLPVYGDDEYLSICEMPIEEVGISYYPYLFIPKYAMYLNIYQQAVYIILHTV